MHVWIHVVKESSGKLLKGMYVVLDGWNLERKAFGERRTLCIKCFYRSINQELFNLIAKNLNVSFRTKVIV